VKKYYHRKITTDAIQEYVGVDVMETIIGANIGQDAIRFQFGHDHFHYDNNSFVAGDRYCDEQRSIIRSAIARSDAQTAREAFGRLSHTVQDLYAHSNYVALWREMFPAGNPEQVEPELRNILANGRLHSGKLYYPLEALSFIEKLQPTVLPLLPRDSHAWMNLDDPSKPDFNYAYSAAVKRTRTEYATLVSSLSQSDLKLFAGLEKG
jgi:hypothetical protein